MFRLIRNSDPRKKPPYGSRIDPTHPLAQGLVGCWLLNEGGGDVFDATDGTKSTSVNAGWTTTPYGFAFNPDSTGDIVINKGHQLFPDQIGTVGVFFYRTSQAEAKRHYIGCGASWGNAPFNISTNQYGTNRLFIGQNNTGYVKYWDTNTNFPHTSIIATFDSRSGGSLDNWQAWLNGERLGIPNETGSITGMTESGRVYIANAFDTTSYGDVPIIFVSIWDRWLSNSEIAHLYAEPYSFILVPQYWYMVDFGAVAAGLSIPVAMHHYQQQMRT